MKIDFGSIPIEESKRALSKRSVGRHKLRPPVKWSLPALLVVLAFCLTPTFAQAQQPEYIQPWILLEEADFHFDVQFAVVKCSPSSDPVILLNAFNEAGNVDRIGFTFDLTDAQNNQATIEVPEFAIGQAQMFQASCDSDEYSHLRLAIPEGVDPATISIDITYNR